MAKREQEDRVAGADASEFTLQRIEPGDHLAGLSLGDEKYLPLKTFLRQKALAYHANNLARTYVIIRPGGGRPKVVAYTTLVCGEIAVEGNVSILDEDIAFRTKAILR